MILVPPDTDTIPLVVSRFLLDVERQVITVHRHPVVLAWPILLSVGGLITAIVLSALSVLSADARLLLWLSWVLVLLYTTWKVTDWAFSFCVVTSYRMMVIKGIFVRDVTMMPLATAAHLTLRRSTLGRVFGYGHFIVPPGGQHQDLRTIGYLPYPDQFYLEVCGLVRKNLNWGDQADSLRVR